jgi:hypothetical protein
MGLTRRAVVGVGSRSPPAAIPRTQPASINEQAEQAARENERSYRMSQHKSEVFTSQDLSALLSPVGEARSVGRVSWSLKKPRCLLGVLPVRTTFDGTVASALQIYIKQPSLSTPELQYMVRGVPVRRCDVSGNHRKVKFTTHKHTYEPATGAEGFVPDDIPNVPYGPTVARGLYRAVFAAFAAECFVDLQDGYWQEPPA